MIAGLLLLMTAPPRVPPRPAAPQPAATPAPAPPPVIAGGWAPANPHAAEVRRAFHRAVGAVTPRAHPGARLLSAESQVIAGTNYRILLQLRDGSRWQAVVWHRLDGTYAVIQAARAD